MLVWGHVRNQKKWARKITLNVRISRKVRDRAQAKARRLGMSREQFVEYALVKAA